MAVCESTTRYFCPSSPTQCRVDNSNGRFDRYGYESRQVIEVCRDAAGNELARNFYGPYETTNCSCKM